MKNIAIIFTQIPHGNALGREALDASLALSDINRVSLFFLGDGIFHLLPNQNTQVILSRDYIATFGLLDIYDISNIYSCQEDMQQRGLLDQTLTINVNIVSKTNCKQLISQHDLVLTF